MNPFETRLGRLRAAMAGAGIDLMVLSYGPDITYLTGIQTPLYYTILKGPGDWITSLIVGHERPPTLVLQKSFAVRIGEQTDLSDIRILPDGSDPDRFLAAALADYSPAGKTVAVSKMIWGQTLLSLQAGAPDARFVPATNSWMDAVRALKDPDELALMERAAAITDAAMAATLSQLKVGITEWDVATEVDYQIKRHGGDGSSFYPGIICVGNGSDPQRHIFTRNTPMVLAPGTTVAFDFGVIYKGYCSDFGRSVFIGEPQPEAVAAYRSIVAAKLAVMELMGDGKLTPTAICDFVAERVRADGFGDYYFYSGLGHAIGLEVHEEPWLRPPYNEPIRAGMCFTLEPKVWKPGVFYVRSEDVVVVEATRARALTRAPYDIHVVS